MAETQPMNLDALCYEPEEDRQFLASLVCGQGVADVLGDDLKVTTTAAGDHSVSTAAGSAFIQNDESIGEPQMYWVLNDDAVILQHAANPSGDPRIDMIVATVHDNQYGGGLDDWVLSIVAGTAIAGAQVTNPLGAGYHSGAGVIPDNSIVLSYVRILAGATLTSTILAVDVEDVRLPFVSCGEPRVPSTKWTRTTNQVINHTTETVVTFNAGPSGTAVPNPYYSESGGTITFHEPGVYDVLATVLWQPDTNMIFERARIYQDATIIGRDTVNPVSSATVQTSQQVMGVARVAAGETLQLRVEQGQAVAASLILEFATLEITRRGVLAA